MGEIYLLVAEDLSAPDHNQERRQTSKTCLHNWTDERM